MRSSSGSRQSFGSVASFTQYPKQDLAQLAHVTDHGIRQVKRVVRNWDGVVDDDGKPVPFTPEALEQALQHAWFRAGINKALSESQNGEEARQGN